MLNLNKKFMVSFFLTIKFLVLTTEKSRSSDGPRVMCVKTDHEPSPEKGPGQEDSPLQARMPRDTAEQPQTRCGRATQLLQTCSKGKARGLHNPGPSRKLLCVLFPLRASQSLWRLPVGLR